MGGGEGGGGRNNLQSKASWDLGIHSSEDAIELCKSSSTLTDLHSTTFGVREERSVR